MSPVAMRKLELHVLKSDMDAVLEQLGYARCFQPVASGEKGSPHAADRNEGSNGEERRAIGESLRKLKDLRDLLDLPTPTAIPVGTHLPGPEEVSYLDTLLDKVNAMVAETRSLEEKRTKVRETLEEAESFAGLALPFKELDHLSFLSVRIGRVPLPELPRLETGLGERALLLHLDAEGSIVAVASKKGRFALDSELQRARFAQRELPADFKGLPPELLARLQSELRELDAESAAQRARQDDFRASILPSWEKLSAAFAVLASIESVKEGLESSDFVYRIEGWVPKEVARGLIAELGKVTGQRIAIRVFEPEELLSVREGREKVPVLLKRRAFVSSFEGLVVSYGAPLYGTIDPTPFVAFFFVLLFSIMFGDLGQGFVILLAGLLLRKGKVPGLKKWQAFGPIFVAVGTGSMVMGLLDGSFFANENWLVPLNRAVSGALFGKPMDRFIQIMPEGGSLAKLFAFFGFTLGVGVLINSVGLVVNIVNKWKLGKKGEALFAKTGLAGAVFFWWAIALGVRVLLGSRPSWIDIPGFLLPLLALFCEEPLGHLVDGKKDKAKKEGMLSFAVKGLVAIIESVSYYFSNTLSFLRVGAFALSHAVLSFIVFSMGDLMRLRAPGGIFWEVLVVIIGNSIIIVLEGMIVAIQVVRLQYYEFFSKFFTETGTLFAPFRFEYPKE